MMRLLHAGCGSSGLPRWLTALLGEQGDEIRLDIDGDLRPRPDVVASVTDLGEIGEFDAIYCTHMLEHLFPHDLVTALGEFKRVLKPGGRAFVIVPDLEDIRPTDDVVYESVSGHPITGLDMFFGHRASVAVKPHMAHRNGFTRAALKKALIDAGFVGAEVRRMHEAFELMAVAVK